MQDDAAPLRIHRITRRKSMKNGPLFSNELKARSTGDPYPAITSPTLSHPVISTTSSPQAAPWSMLTVVKILGACRPQDVKFILDVKRPMAPPARLKYHLNHRKLWDCQDMTPPLPLPPILGTSSLKNEDRLNGAIWFTSVVIK
ncbi:hypothetical protein B0H16DRAFT_1741377 [Mycena metata]|uniref:Uncharacterized protein n=1 Tax=Mycena metata TaxID=1033252 RepID=A0AAD7MGH4_9AGAR|nr:hypothetical protein B0H16DRAFT_1741377 [Mycena metata]